jgi:hypothetical protein
MTLSALHVTDIGNASDGLSGRPGVQAQIRELCAMFSRLAAGQLYLERKHLLQYAT